LLCLLLTRVPALLLVLLQQHGFVMTSPLLLQTLPVLVLLRLQGLLLAA
jgi:hypothetical protein